MSLAAGHSFSVIFLESTSIFKKLIRQASQPITQQITLFFFFTKKKFFSF
jgi:hypothetical protein